MAVDDHRSTVWIATGESVLSYGFDGTARFAVPVELHGGSATLLAVNSTDGSLWLADDSRLRSFSAAGQALQSLPLHSDIVGLSIDSGEGLLWVATAKSVTAYDALAGTLLRTLALGRDADVRDVSADAATQTVWVAKADGLRRFAADGTLLLATPLRGAAHVSAGPSAGVWAATGTDLAHLSGSGQVLGTLRPFGEDGEISQVVSDPSDGTAWAASAHDVAHAGAGGQLLRRLDFDPPVSIRGLAVYADLIPPQLQFILPVSGSFISSHTPTLEVGYSDIGSGVDANSLAFQIAGSALAVSCAYAQSGATCTPSAPIPDGPTTVTATVKDFAGNLSPPAQVTFTLDTIPPSVTITSPAGGLVTNQRQQTVAGSISEQATVTVNGAPAAVTSSLTFSLAITLQEGPNSIRAVATDRAGNQGQASVQVTLDTIPPNPVDPRRVSVSQASNGLVSVSAGPGAAEAGAVAVISNLRTGLAVSVTVAGDGSFAATVAAQGGDTLSIVLTDAAGNRGQAASIVVPAGQPPPPGIPPDPATLAPPLDPTVATEFASATHFLYTGSTAIQTGVAAGAIDPRTVAVVRGKVKTPDGSALPGVKVSVFGHPEFGSTISRQDGMFDLALNAGGLFMLRYEKSGFPPAYHRVKALWRSYASAEDAVMVPYDGQVTTLTLGASATQVARGGAVQDSSGSRRATLLLPPGTQAQMVMPDGTNQALATLSFRATEYTVGPSGPAAMPGPLPPTSGYTYAVELSADEAVAAGADSVRFSQPVPLYVENFLGFPVGGIVPLGFFDRRAAAWAPLLNGVVVMILGTTGGMADLDLDGSGQPASAAQLAAAGITDAERQQLAILYSAGQTLWRVPLDHFSAADCNWPFVLPADAIPPDQPPPQADQPADQPDCEEGSVIEAQNQTVGEDLPVAGTPFALSYRSDRTPGRKNMRRIDVPLTGATVPASLTHVQLQISVGGQTFVQTFSSAPNQSYTFQWDGNDAYGRAVHGSSTASIQIGFSYPTFYEDPSPAPRSFGRGGTPLGLPTRNELTLWSGSQLLLASRDIRTFGAAGWSLTPHHVYDPEGRVILQGDGTTRTFSDQGATAVAADTLGAFGTMDAQGNVYTLEQAVVRKLSPNGALTVVAGNGTAGYSGDGGPATQAQINQPFGVAVDTSGNVYIGDGRNGRIRRVDGQGIITTVAGDGHFPSDPNPPDGTVAAATDMFPSAITLDPNGVLYIAQSMPTGAGGIIRAIWRLEAGGLLTIVYSRFSSFSGVRSIAADGLGNVYFSDGDGVQKISPPGVATIVVGAGGPPAYPPINVTVFAVDAAGDVFVPDPNQHRVAKILPNGSFTLLPMVFDFADAIVLGPQGGPVIWNGTAVQGFGPLIDSYVPAGLNIPSDDGSQVFVFDNDGRHLRTVDSLTGAVLYSFTYDAAQRLAAITDVDGNTTSIQRDAQGNASVIVAPFGQVTQLTTGADGELASVSDPANQTTAFSYSQGLMASMTDARGGVYQFSYDDAGRLTRDQDPAGGFKQLSRTAGLGSYQVAVTTALGNTTGYSVTQLAGGLQEWVNTDPAGTQDISIVGQDGSVTETAADGSVSSSVTGPDPRFLMTAPLLVSGLQTTPSGLTAYFTHRRSVILDGTGDPLSLSSLTDFWTLNGRPFTQTFDRSQLSWTLLSPAGRQLVKTVSPAGRPTSLQLGTLEPVQFYYDSAGRISSKTQGTGAAQRTLGFSYRSDGRLGSFTDALQRTSVYAWDAAGRLTSQTYPDGRTVGFAYDANGNLTAVIPPGRAAHRFAFTAVDLTQSYTPPDLGSGPTVTTYSYNLERKLSAMTRPDGTAVLFNYQKGRLASVNFDSGTISLTYDPRTSLLQTVTAPSGETVAYANDGPLPTISSLSGPVAGSVERSFNQEFLVSSQTVNGQQPIAFQYDGDGLVIQAGLLGLSRDPSNGVVSATVLDTITTTESQSSFGELSSVSAAYAGNEFFRSDFTRDSGGRIARKVEAIAGATSTYDYAYDAAGRLSDVRKDGALLSHFDYDGNSNRVSTVEGTVTTTATYDAQDRLLQYGDMTYAYTANGDLLSKTQGASTVTYTYDSLGNLTSLVDANGIRTDYLVDGQNRRVGTRVDGVLVQGFLWQDQLKVAAELDGGGNVVSSFVYATNKNVPDYMVKNGITYRVLAEPLGSPRLVIDSSSGQVAQRLDYDAWGRVTLDTNPGFQPFGFAGGLYDSRTGLVRFGLRDYDAVVGRWTARDPALFSGGDANLYGYVVGDPVNLKDPQGLDTFDCKMGLGGSREPDGCQGPFCHEYLCVIDKNGKVTCGGQGAPNGAGSGGKLFGNAPGANDSRAFNRKHCPLVRKGDKCFDDCIKSFIAAPRPPYNALDMNGGKNCQAWADVARDACRVRCHGKDASDD